MARQRLDPVKARRVRLIQSMRDFDVAAEAAAALHMSFDAPSKELPFPLHGHVLETAMVVSYARPFSASRGEVPPLTPEMADVVMDKDAQRLHRRLVKLRNRSFAHSDADMMRFNAVGMNPADHGLDIGGQGWMLVGQWDVATLLSPADAEQTVRLARGWQHAIVERLSKEVEDDREGVRIAMGAPLKAPFASS